MDALSTLLVVILPLSPDTACREVAPSENTVLIAEKHSHPGHPKHVHQDLVPGLKPPGLEIRVHDEVWPDAPHRV
jgi:hypothetical protein